jgi:hypothetical protein
MVCLHSCLSPGAKSTSFYFRDKAFDDLEKAKAEAEGDKRRTSLKYRVGREMSGVARVEYACLSAFLPTFLHDTEAGKYSVESPEAETKLAALKARCLATKTALCRQEDYKNPEEGARLMYEDLKAKLQPRIDLARADFEHGDPEQAKHDVFRKNRSKVTYSSYTSFPHLVGHLS